MAEVANWLMVFLRAGALLVLMPVLGTQNIPVRVRLGLAACLSLLVAPGLPPTDVATLSMWGLITRVTQELGAGLLLGFVTRLVFYGLDFAAGIITAEIGLNVPGIMNPLNDSQSGAPAMAMFLLGSMLFLSLDLHHWLLVAFQRSYAVLPVGGASLDELTVLEVVHRSALAFGFGVRVAAPFIAVAFVVTLIFSVLGRAVPQMNVFTESFAVRILAGLSVFGLTCSLLAHHLSEYLRRLPEDALRVARLLGSGG